MPAVNNPQLNQSLTGQLSTNAFLN